MARFGLSLAVPPRETPVRYGGLMRELLGFHLLLLNERHDAELEARLPAPANGTSEATQSASAARLLDRLETALTLRWETARRTLSDREMADLRATQYLMCALADDLFLYEVEWRGATAWSADVLEQRIFGTRVAGERVFETASDLVRRRDPAAADLAAVHLAILGMGFKGRHRGSDNAMRLNDHARALFELLAGRAAGPTFGAHDLIPGAISNVAVGQRAQRRRGITIGPSTMLAILGGFVALSTLIWFHMTSDLAAVASAVLRAAE